MATFPEIPGLGLVASGRPLLRLETPDGAWQLQPSPAAPARTDLSAWADRLAEELDHGERRAPIVVDTFISSAARRALDEARVSYVDAHGHLALVVPGLLIRLLPAPPPRRAGSEGLGVAGVRAVQVLLEDPGKVWSVIELARSSEVSAGQAHRVFSILESLDLVVATGAGPAKRRRLRSPRTVLDWLVASAPRSIRGGRRSYLYAPGPNELIHRLAERIQGSDLPVALTGAAGALALGSGPTSLSLAVLRVAPRVSLAHVAALLGADLGERGANLELWPDTGELGTYARRWVNGVPVAPEVRIYLDLLHEPRGQDLAEQFRETVLGW